MVRRLFGNGDNPILDGDGIVTCVEIKDAAAVVAKITLDAFDCALGYGVVLDTAPVFELTKPYNQFNDAMRYDTPLHLFFQMRAKIQFHDSLSTHTSNWPLPHSKQISDLSMVLGCQEKMVIECLKLGNFVTTNGKWVIATPLRQLIGGPNRAQRADVRFCPTNTTQ